MNRKGDVAMTMMFVAALILCVAALIIFFSSGREYGNIISEHNMLVEGVNNGEKLIYQESDILMKQSINGCVGCDEINLKKLVITNSAQRKSLHPNAKTNFFSKIEKGEFEIKKTSEGYTFEIKDVTFVSEKGIASIRRTKLFKGLYGNDGEFKRFIKE